MKCFSFLLIIFLFSSKLLGQINNSINSKDSLDSKSFDELKNIFYSSNIDSVKRKIAIYTLQKAKKESNYKAIANSYQRIYRSTNDLSLGEKYLDSSIRISKNKNLKTILAEGYFFKGLINEGQKKYNNSLSYYIRSKDIYEKEGDFKMLNTININIAILKLRVDQNESALKILKESLEFSNENGYYDSRTSSYLNLLYALGVAYGKVNKLDSASYINNLGYKFSKSINSNFYFNFIQLEGANQFKKKKFLIAKDSLEKVITYLKTENDYLNLSITYNLLGQCYQELNNEVRAIDYFIKIDSIFNNNGSIYLESRSAYEALIQYYHKNNDIKNKVYYSDMLLKVDSILYDENENLATSLYKKYDEPKIEKKENTITKLKKSKKKFIFWILFLIIVLIGLSLALVYNRKKRKKYEQKFQELLTEKNKKVKPKKKNLKSLNINDDIIEKIITNLNDFETNKRFLEKGIQIGKLSKEFNTNSRYLSKVINTLKEKDFRNYINDLRIDYAIKKIQNDSTFRKYTITAIADEVGFSNQESYSKAFYKRTGFHTSFFIKKINNISN